MQIETSTPGIAYFSMEICLEADIPTYSGGLGVLAGDTLRSAADLGVPMIAVTLLHKKGYFRQHLDSAGNQSESAISWSVDDKVRRTDLRVSVEIEGRAVALAAWCYVVGGVSGHAVPVYLLDSALEENHERDRGLTDHLYGGDASYRLRQETLLGLGGAAVVDQLCCGASSGSVDERNHGKASWGKRRVVYHINEGHAALLGIHLLEKNLRGAGDAEGGPLALREISEEDIAAVRAQMVFTTHTPVPAGHDRFPLQLVTHILGDTRARMAERIVGNGGHELNLTELALRCSRYVNAVSMRHRDVSREMFPGYGIDAITNGVHAATWISAPVAALLDEHCAGWRSDNSCLRHALGVSSDDIRRAHSDCKGALLDEVRRKTGVELRADSITIGFARRATPYKRADLIFSDLNRLREMAHRHGRIQLVFAGKAHPHDEAGKDIIRRIFHAAAELRDHVNVVYLEGYDMRLGALMTSGVDVWLNNPARPLEASGTSGMKAALNGVPTLSVLDGWWLEGHLEGVTGWSVGESGDMDADPSADAESLLDKLDSVVLPLYAAGGEGWAAVMRGAIAHGGTYFNTQRMVRQYAARAYRL
jgi:starch phosphorylase